MQDGEFLAFAPKQADFIEGCSSHLGELSFSKKAQSKDSKSNPVRLSCLSSMRLRSRLLRKGRAGFSLFSRKAACDSDCFTSLVHEESIGEIIVCKPANSRRPTRT